ncbi:MAG: YbjN domain-containing protein [Pseudomonadota bacterium]|nr:YbjN domain-containing protein [Pseudomonadota bacterium]
MGKLFDVAVSWLEDNDWSFSQHETEKSVYAATNYQGDHSTYRLILEAYEKIDVFLVYVYISTKIPEKKYVAIAELLTRINFGLRLSSFQFDMNDGTIRCKCSVDVEGSSLSPEMVNSMVGTALSSADEYFPAVMQIAFADKTPLQALQSLSNEGE